MDKKTLKKDRKKRYKLPFLPIWLVAGRELARLDSKIVILEARYKQLTVKSRIAARMDAEALKTVVYKSLEKAVAGLQDENRKLTYQNEKLRNEIACLKASAANERGTERSC